MIMWDPSSLTRGWTNHFSIWKESLTALDHQESFQDHILFLTTLIHQRGKDIGDFENTLATAVLKRKVCLIEESVTGIFHELMDIYSSQGTAYSKHVFPLSILKELCALTECQR